MRRLHEDHLVQSLAGVIMPDHVHWLVTLSDEAHLSHAIRLLKGRSARAINRYAGTEGPLWQSAFYDHALRAEKDLQGVARYIVANPLRARLVAKLADYPHWDAIWL